ncbi:MAG: 2-oxoacid:ferredoxin oxidoreductase subunit beta [Anaerolineae bacterium]|nr:2-oxoacid:ferredoxin oxidoreductase subunit beta [Anaerolineae bacterium]
MTARAGTPNVIGLVKSEYDGAPTTLCQGCGHNSISAQIIDVCYEMGVRPSEIIKLSGIGCSSKAPAYFLNQSHGFNTLHGRMPSVATGATLANHHLAAIGISGDGDTGSIGLGQFIHMVRRNVPMVYIIENNGVYGLTKGQFSATADEGQKLKYAGVNEMPPLDMCMEALIADCTFIARSFSGNAKQVRSLMKAAFSHKGTAVLDIISPCVTFNNNPDSTKSYDYGRSHQIELQEIGYVPHREEIQIEDDDRELIEVTMHDGSVITLKKATHDPRDKSAAIRLLTESKVNKQFITGLIYIGETRETLPELANVPSTPLAHLSDDQIRPSRAALEKVMADLI